MPKNTGTPPPYERVDIKFRNEVVVRGVEPRKYRWTLDDPKFGVGYEFDIVVFQKA